LYQIQVSGPPQPNQKVNERRRWWFFSWGLVERGHADGFPCLIEGV
jgi:hypothetical protein